MKRAIFILLALIALIVAAALALVSVHKGIELIGLLAAALLVALGAALIFPRPFERWFRPWFHPSDSGMIGRYTSSVASDPLQPQPRVLLTRKDLRPWMYAALAAATLTFVALLAYSTTSLPDQWGFHFGAWAKKGPLRIPVFVCALFKFLLARIVYGTPVGNFAGKMLPEILAYYPRTVSEAGRTFLALLEIATTLLVLYLGQLLIFVEIVGVLSN